MDLQSEYGYNCTCVRSNTVCCDFSFLKCDVAALELHDFVEDSLRVAPETLELLQWNTVQKCLYLRLKTYTMAKNLVLLHNNRHMFPPGRYGTRVALSLVDAPSVVMVSDLSEMVTDLQVRDALDQYGVVLYLGHSLWGVGVTYAGVRSGQRVVRMIIRKPIPRKLYIGGEKTTVVYPNQLTEASGLRGRLAAAVARGWRRVGRAVRRLLL